MEAVKEPHPPTVWAAARLVQIWEAAGAAADLAVMLLVKA